MNAIETVRQVLTDRRIVLVGGDPRPNHAKRLETAFRLREALWVPTRESDASSRNFSSVLRRGNASLVVALHGLLRHQHARDLHELCRVLDLPVLAYWRGPNPAGLASAIIERKLIASLQRRIAA
jgi:hypothetical protein